jgi:glycosyltransferase involved in cell wall biosynthesis
MNITVVMPARNAEKSIRRAVTSTLRSMGPKDELLLGLHNCSDETLAISQAIFDPRLKISSHEDCTFSDVLNDLCRKASGDYIARMDADDYCLPWRFFVQKRLAKKLPYTLLFSPSVIGIPIFGGKKIYVSQYPFRLTTAAIYTLLVETNPLNHPTFFGPKTVLSQLGGYRSMAGEDLDLWLRAALSEVKIYRSRFPLLVYNLSPNQLSREPSYMNGWTDSEEIRDSRRRLREKIEKSPFIFSPFGKLTLTLQVLGLPTPRRLISKIRKRSSTLK